MSEISEQVGTCSIAYWNSVNDRKKMYQRRMQKVTNVYVTFLPQSTILKEHDTVHVESGILL